MSLLIDQMATWLQTQGEGTVGTTIFKINRPPTPVACVSLHATGGYPPDNYTAIERPTLMFFARAATPSAALQKAYSLWRRLHRRSNLNLGGNLWALSILAIASPAYVGTEQAADQTAHLVSFNIALQLREPSS